MIHLPELLPDEFLAGFVGRMARMNGLNRLQTWRPLLDHVAPAGGSDQHRTWTHALSAALQLPADALARDHTMAPIIRAMRPPGESLRHADPCDADALRQCEFALPASAPQFCIACVEEDLDFWGISYWRRSHQIRGGLTCPKHGDRLRLADANTARNAFPEECVESAVAIPASGNAAMFGRFAEIAAGLLELPEALPADRVLLRLLDRCGSGQVEWHHNRRRAPLGDIVRKTLAGSGLEHFFCTLQDFGPQADRHWTRCGPGYSLALALLALYSDADEALRDVLRPLSVTEEAHARLVLPPDRPGLLALVSQRAAPQVLANLSNS